MTFFWVHLGDIWAKRQNNGMAQAETPVFTACLTGVLISVIRLPSVSIRYLPPHIAEYESFVC
jgi:hypothetical protein